MTETTTSVIPHEATVELGKAIAVLRHMVGGRTDLTKAHCHFGVTKPESCTRCSGFLAAWDLIEAFDKSPVYKPLVAFGAHDDGQSGNWQDRLPVRHPAEALLRQMLAAHYTSKPGFYGDDGERQFYVSNGSYIDFNRDSVDEIKDKIATYRRICWEAMLKDPANRERLEALGFTFPPAVEGG